MQLVKPMSKSKLIIIFLFFISSKILAQENSPFSRYGLGDIYPQQNILSRGMGGVSTAVNEGTAINTTNPASYGYIAPVIKTLPLFVTYDIGISIDARTLLSASPVAKYNSTNFTPSYIQLGIPLNHKGVGLVFGLRPYSRINYSIASQGRKFYQDGTSDSIQNLFEGNGGLNQVFAGLGKRWKNFAVGVNGGYQFGQKYLSTKVSFINDSVLYYKSNSTDTSKYWGLFVSPGISGFFKLKEYTDAKTKITDKYFLNIGGSGTFEQSLKVNKDITRQTFFYNANGGTDQIDSISKQPNILGTISIPLTFNAGFQFQKTINGVNKWSIGADYTATQWTKYRFYGQPDQLNNSSQIRVGGEFSPNPLDGKNSWSRGTYRAGFYTGKDYENADNNGYKVSAITLGASINIRNLNRQAPGQFSMIHTAIEIGKRGTAVNNITENFFKVSVGFSLSDIWFTKRKYD